MNEYDYTKPDQPEPWEENSYRTGRTQPPKNRSGLIAVLLAVIILLGGMVSALGLMNIKLFRKANELPEENSGNIGFIQDASTAPTVASVPDSTGAPVSGDTSIHLNQTPEAIENIPQTGGLSLQEIYAKNIDSVVSIICNNGASTGTGVVVSANGYIVTNAHVVENATSVQVLFTDKRTLDASPVGLDAISDLAVLRVDAVDLTAAEFGDSSTLQVGDAVVAIGDPLGVELRGTMTDGIVSAINRDITTEGRTMTLIQTNAALNSGNSGGPLLNCYGQVIGINTMKIGDYMNANGVEGLGFAIPSTTVKEIVDQLISQGYISGRPTIGITGQEISTFDQLYYRIPQGIYITEVVAGSDAEAKGIQPGDILLQFAGARITNSEALKNALYAHQAGDSVTIVIYRNGNQYAIDIILGQSQ